MQQSRVPADSPPPNTAGEVFSKEVFGNGSRSKGYFSLVFVVFDIGQDIIAEKHSPLVVDIDSDLIEIIFDFKNHKNLSWHS